MLLYLVFVIFFFFFFKQKTAYEMRISDWSSNVCCSDLQMRVIFAMPGNEAFAQALAEACGVELGVLETRRFPDGESYVRLLTDVTDKCVDLVCTLARPDEGFLNLVFAADAARDLGVREVTLVAPYLSYMRQDRSFQLGEAVSSTSFARLVSATFDRSVQVDPLGRASCRERVCQYG